MTESYSGDVSDHFSKKTYLKEKNLTVNTFYRLGFSGEKSCGFVQVVDGDPKDGEDVFEMYKELIECGIGKEEVEKRHQKIIEEIEGGKLDVSF